MLNKDEFAAGRLILKKAGETQQAFKAELEAAITKPEKFDEFPQATLDRLHEDFLQSDHAQQYMFGRSFEMDTLKHFKIGFSAKRDMVCVPMYDSKGVPLGIIGRSIEGKRFHNSPNLPKSKTLWNLHNAKAASDTAILVEASFDGMRCHQAGFPNTMALLGGTLSREQIMLLDKYFNTIIIMTDDDPKRFNESCAKCRRRGLNMCAGHSPGLELGHSIANALHRKSIKWASYTYGARFPEGAKDNGDISDEQIKEMIRNSVPHFEFNQWSLG